MRIGSPHRFRIALQAGEILFHGVQGGLARILRNRIAFSLAQVQAEPAQAFARILKIFKRSASSAVTGYLDVAADDGKIAGWSADSKNQGSTIQVKIFVDTASSKGSPTATVSANQPRDLSSVKISGQQFSAVMSTSA